MTLGEQFKQLRSQKGLSQPELAELAGIEQSYLSKLENDKSLPSNEIFRKMLSALSVNVAQILQSLEQNYVKKNLMVIADIEHHCQQASKSQLRKQRNMLYGASILIVVAVTLFFIGFTKELFNETMYQYQSDGVVLAGEPSDIFSKWPNLIDETDRNKHDGLLRKQKALMAKRSDIKVHLSRVDKGQFFVTDVTGGKRLYQNHSVSKVPRAINAWLQVLGVFLFVSGLMCFVLERRLFNYK